MPAYVDAVLAEAITMAENLHHPVMETVFLGGGTPSILPPQLLDRLLDGLHRIFTIAPDAEFTTEANPGTLSEEWLRIAVAHGVNRLSMGMQAFQPELLYRLGRIHDFSMVQDAVAMARQEGINNISLDLMFGLPGQTMTMWQESLASALSLSPAHLSCYGLIPEEDTPLMADLEAGRLSLPDEDLERAMYDEAIQVLADNGFVQYEIPNFAKPGYACRHNLGYWRQVPYLGLGASASSMLPDQCSSYAYLRTTNPRNLQAYLQMVANGAWNQRDIECITPAEARFETLMLGLRTMDGVHEDAFLHLHGLTLDQCFGSRLRSLKDRGLLEKAEGRWFLTRRGMDIQNSILVELMDD